MESFIGQNGWSAMNVPNKDNTNIELTKTLLPGCVP